MTDVVRLYLKWAQEGLDQNNDYFPIWGTCLGLQALLTLDVLERHDESTAKEIMKMTYMKGTPHEAIMGSVGMKLSQELKPQSKMFSGIPEDVFEVLALSHLLDALHIYSM